MATRRRSSGSAGIETLADDALRGRDILLERIESQMQFVIEAVTGMQETFDVKLSALEERLTARIGILEDVVRKNSEDIRKNSEDIRSLRLELAGLRQDFERRQEPGRLQALEKRVSRIERKLGIGRDPRS